MGRKVEADRMFADFVEQHRDEMVSTLQALLQIPSVEGEAEPGAPFGAACREALQFVLDLAAAHGLVTQNADGYAGHVEYGDGDPYIAVLSHLDVVPPGNHWTYPPFGAEIHNGSVYARGAIDDKGPALATLWALIALKELNLRPRRKIRLIFGLDEESGWLCMKHYFSKYPQPLGGFTPDADFPMIHAEKGVATLRIDTRADTDSMNPRVIRFTGGDRVNMVPDHAMAVVDCHSETAAQEWEQKLGKEARAKQIDANISVKGDAVEISVHGTSAHGSTPDLGKNAITRLAALLSSQPVANASMWRAIAAQDTAGRALGIDCADDVTGSLTSNLGRAELTGDTFSFWFNIRYPVDVTGDELVQRCQAYVSDKWGVHLVSNRDPLFVSPDSPVIRCLAQVYEQYTGNKAEPIAIGGATYARAITNGVAFGPLFPGQPDRAHQKDEHWSLQDYFLCTQIYAHAMFELANTL
ncbi:dipeptidase PepV [Alicyclobacillus macrosporangiidus]|uniref:dipeptidase PepV n=1 Tax=Alicyclobacillus macrosporangiidus TaxID=392015 RepID=UPI0006925F2B|nr:dipeptidase PepV [Alicyclobacillus macrosporangiidus]